MVSRGPYDSKSGAELDPKTLGERIKKLRWHRGWTQEDLSRAVNTEQAIISNWERDKVRPSGAALAALAQVFQLTPAALESGEGFQLQSPPRPGKAPLELELPEPGEAAVMLLDLKKGTPQAADFQEALGALLKATQAGRSVWVVFR